MAHRYTKFDHVLGWFSLSGAACIYGSSNLISPLYLRTDHVLMQCGVFGLLLRSAAARV